MYAPTSVSSQSTDQNFPTPITGPEIRGTIKARDIGDSRLTTYFYAFNGDQGDVFINVVSKNFNGDIDIFSLEGLRPLSKIVIYSGGGLDETGRIVYLRRSERMLLRIEGRPPGDDPATFTIKFAGSFVALKAVKGSTDPAPPPIASANGDGIRLNSAGAVISEPSRSDALKRTESGDSAVDSNRKNKSGAAAKPSSESPTDKSASAKKDTKKILDDSNDSKKAADEKKSGETPSGRKSVPPATKTAKTGKDEPDPLAGVKLVITLKNGEGFQRPMSEIVRFSADKGFLLVIAKDGTIVRYLLTEIASITMQ